MLVEPFVGGFNVVPAVRPVKARCSDVHKGLIELLRSVQFGWVPPETLTIDQYNVLRECANDLDPMKAFAEFGCSYAGKSWGGFARYGERNYARQASRALVRKAAAMAHVIFHATPYDAVRVDPGDVVYADPPYEATTGYRGIGCFDSAAFWAWAEHMSARAVVFVSEFTAPPQWASVWSQTRKVTAGPIKHISATEHLFRFNPPSSLVR